MKKYLIFDCNYILNKNIFTLIKTNSLYGDFFKALDNNIQKYVSMADFDKVILVSDSRRKSWRKRLHTEYKGQRTTDPTIDWEWIYQSYQIWKEESATNYGYTVLESDSIEGDDWISSLTYQVWKSNSSAVIISSDKDMGQLLKWSQNGIIFQIEDTHGKERVYMPHGWQLYKQSLQTTEDDDPFQLDGKTEWQSFINTISHWSIVDTDPVQSLVTKLIKGDKSDNIESVYQKVIKDGKIQNIGDAGADKIWTLYTEQYGNDKSDSEQFYQNLAECVCKVNKLESDKRDGIIKKLKWNRQLIELHHKWLPDDIKERIVEQLEKI